MRRLVASCCAGIVVAAVLVTGPNAWAGHDGNPDTVGEAKAAVAETTARLDALNKRVQAIEADLAASRAEVARTQSAAQAAQADFAALSQQVTSQQREIDVARTELEATQAEISRQEYLSGALARQMYTAGPLNEMALVLDAETPADMVGRIAAFDAVARYQQTMLADLSVIRADGVQQVNLQAARIIAVQQRQAEAAEALAAAKALKAQAQSAADDVAGALAAKRDLGDRLRNALREDQRQYDELRAEAERLRRELKARAAANNEAGGSGSSAPPSAGVLQRPVPGGVTSPYGMRVHPVTGEYKLHTGVDLQASCGDPIRAARGGTVLQAGFNGAYGYRSVIDHGQVGSVSLVTTYNHQTRLGISAGQRVTTGQIIGWAGTTGYSTGCHLHFEVLVNGNFTDPLGWI